MRTRAIFARLRGVITTRRYTNGIASCRDHTSKALRYGTRSHGISQFYLKTRRGVVHFRTLVTLTLTLTLTLTQP